RIAPLGFFNSACNASLRSSSGSAAMSRPSRCSRSNANTMSLRDARGSPIHCWSNPKRLRPASSIATISPSSTHDSHGSARIASTTCGSFAVQSRPLRDCSQTRSPRRNITMRKPSYFTSWIQSSPVGAASTRRASARSTLAGNAPRGAASAPLRGMTRCFRRGSLARRCSPFLERRVVGDERRHDEFVGALEQEPCRALGRLGADQRPAASQALAEELEVEMAVLQRLHRIVLRTPGAVVPDVHDAGAVVTFGDGAFETAVLERMILHFHREPLDLGIERRTFRHRPAAQRATDLQPEVEVPMAREVQLHDELRARGRGWSCPTRGLRRRAEIAHAPIFRQPCRRHQPMNPPPLMWMNWPVM